MRLKGKNVLVTGGNSGIGFAVAQSALAEGANLWLHGRDQGKVDQAIAQLTGHAKGLVADISSIPAIEQMVDELRRQIDGLDGLIVNAGTARFAPIDQADETLFDQLVSVNFKGAFFTIRSLLPLLHRGSSVVINGSVLGKKGLPGSSIYAATKAAVRSLARSLAPELASRGIRINVVSPGPVLTPLLDKQGLKEEDKTQILQSYETMTLMGRAATPQDIAPAFTYLLADDSSFVTGIELDCDGGMAQI
jgi:NAD(P)-dependent dehydrogenase (short-subunit alcohol dehydrogenase family)